MAEPTLLQQARQRLEMAEHVPPVELGARVAQLGIAVARIVQHLEAQQTSESWRQTRYAQGGGPGMATLACDHGIIEGVDCEQCRARGWRTRINTPPTVSMHDYELAPGESLELPHGLVTNRGTAKVFLNLRTGIARAEAAPLAEDDLTAIEKLCARATTGPWVFDDDSPAEPYVADPDGRVVCELNATDLVDGAENRGAVMRDNGEFIAAARDALPKLIAKVRELEAREQRLLPVLQAFGIDSITARSVMREVGKHG